MGNLVNRHQLYITISKPSLQLFDFRNDYQEKSIKLPMVYPSFIKNNHTAIQYSQRANFTDRQYEITLSQDSNPVIHFKRLPTANQTIWKALGMGQKVVVSEGDEIKIAGCQFVIKKICKRFSDIEDLEDNVKTLSDIDINEYINLANSKMFNQSRNLKRSKYAESSKLLHKIQSIESIGGDIDHQFCRVCFGKTSNQKNPLLSLCKCKGSVKSIHYFCLKRWITSKSKHTSNAAYEYYEYDLSCDLCKQKIDKIIEHNNRKYVVFTQTLNHPPFIVMSYKNSSTKVSEFIINFDHKKTVTLGKSKGCDITFNDKYISQEHCELIYQNNELFLKNLNPSFGTFVNFKQLQLSSENNSIELMIGNHLVTVKDESINCLPRQALQIKIQDDCIHA